MLVCRELLLLSLAPQVRAVQAWDADLACMPVEIRVPSPYLSPRLTLDAAVTLTDRSGEPAILENIMHNCAINDVSNKCCAQVAAFQYMHQGH